MRVRQAALAVITQAWRFYISPVLSCIAALALQYCILPPLVGLLFPVIVIWFLLVSVRIESVRRRLAARYHQRVTLPVQFWVAAGRPPQFRPHIPWWQPLAYSYLHRRHRRSRRR